MKGRVFALTALVVLGVAAEEKPTASGFKEVLRSSSDAVVYVDTAQRDRKPDRELDRHIKSCLEKMQAANPGGGAFEDPLAKPFLLGANVELTSRNPLRLAVDGRLGYEDVGAITNFVSMLDRSTAEEGGPRFKLALGEDSDGGRPFEFLCGQTNRPPRAGSGACPDFARALASMKTGDPFFFVVFRGRRFAPLTKDRELMRTLFSAETVAVSCSFDGRLVRFDLMVVFVDEESAVESETSGVTVIKQFASGLFDGMFRDFKVTRNGRDVSYSFAADNAKIWGMDEAGKGDGQKPVAQ